MGGRRRWSTYAVYIHTRTHTHLHVVLSYGNQYVLWLQIPVHNAMLVQVKGASGDITHHEGSHVVGDAWPELLQKSIQVHWHALCDHMQASWAMQHLCE